MLAGVSASPPPFGTMTWGRDPLATQKTQISSSCMSFGVCRLDSVLGSFHRHLFPSLSFYNKISLILSFPSALSSCIICAEANKSRLNYIIPVDFLTVRSTTNLTSRRQPRVAYSFQCLTLGAPNIHYRSISLDPMAITSPTHQLAWPISIIDQSCMIQWLSCNLAWILARPISDREHTRKVVFLWYVSLT